MIITDLDNPVYFSISTLVVVGKIKFQVLALTLRK